MTNLDADQREIWDLAHPRVIEPSGDQTLEQARHFAVESFKHACWFDGVDPPADDVICVGA
ncbi:MAG: hypothetical protein DLM64_06050 [Solirubrobacterales bacterium]|nr:MAG: hypothetical protein DLM64_06050 [Solirubrobacterales bacterium]